MHRRRDRRSAPAGLSRAAAHLGTAAQFPQSQLDALAQRGDRPVDGVPASHRAPVGRPSKAAAPQHATDAGPEAEAVRHMTGRQERHHTTAPSTPGVRPMRAPP